MSDAATERRVKILFTEGTVEALDAAVAILVRGGSSIEDAQRRAFGIAPEDVATIAMPRGKVHMVRSIRSPAIDPELRHFWTYCGRSASGEISWRPRWLFSRLEAPLFGDAPTPGFCKSCETTMMGTLAHERQEAQALKIGIVPFRCRRGEHSHVRWSASKEFSDRRPDSPCKRCGHVELPLFGIL